jgi:hypothetical protein
LLDGIHLPNLMRLLRADALRRRLAARRRGRLLQRAEAALKRAFAGEFIDIGIPKFQPHEKVSGAPARVQFVQRKCFLQKRGGRGRRRRTIRGFECRLAAFEELLAEASHGPRGQSKFASDVGWPAVLLKTFEDEPPKIG